MSIIRQVNNFIHGAYTFRLKEINNLSGFPVLMEIRIGCLIIHTQFLKIALSITI